MRTAEVDEGRGSGADDRTGRARIRDAALECFAEAGVAGTSIRTIARAAGVSPALVIHHFGSKDALRVACDEHVAAVVRERKREAVATGGGDPVAALRGYERGAPLMRYLARTLIDGSQHVADLIDEMVEDAVAYSADAVRNGTMRPSDLHRERVVVLTLWSLGALVLHEHLQRLLDVDITGDMRQMGPYLLPAAELLTHGAISVDYHERVRDAFSRLQGEASERSERVGGRGSWAEEEGS